MESKENTKNPSEREDKRVNKTWEAIQKHKGIWSFTNPKWISLREELLSDKK